MNDQRTIKWALVVIAACVVVLTLAYVAPKAHDAFQEWRHPTVPIYH